MATTRNKTKKKIDNEAAVLEKVAAMPEPYRAMGERLHELILESAPELEARPWYGMPGYAKGSGPVLCFFRVDDYMTFGLTEKASFELEDGRTRPAHGMRVVLHLARRRHRGQAGGHRRQGSALRYVCLPARTADPW